MCVRTTCRGCGKPDWSGCGAHRDIVLRGVPEDQRCRCREDGTRAGAAETGSWFSRILGIGRGRGPDSSGEG